MCGSPDDLPLDRAAGRGSPCGTAAARNAAAAANANLCNWTLLVCAARRDDFYAVRDAFPLAAAGVSIAVLIRKGCARNQRRNAHSRSQPQR